MDNVRQILSLNGGNLISTSTDIELGAPQIRNLNAPPMNGQTARRAAKNFWERYKNSGIAGLAISSQERIKRFMQIKTLDSAQYCFLIDAMSMDLNRAAQKALGTPEFEYFSSRAVLGRFSMMVQLLQLEEVRPKLLDEWTAVFQKAMADSSPK